MNSEFVSSHETPDYDNGWQDQDDWYRELEMLEAMMQNQEIGNVEVPIFTSYSNGRGRKRANPVEVVLVMTRERVVRREKGTKVFRKYKQHRDGDDRLSALVKEILGEAGEDFNEQECLEWVYQQQQQRQRFRLLSSR